MNIGEERQVLRIEPLVLPVTEVMHDALGLPKPERVPMPLEPADPMRAGEAYVQHYFDSRGVARVYQMGFRGGLWTLSRTTADYSPLEFSQRYSGRFTDDGNTIDGAWEVLTTRKTWEKRLRPHLPADT